MPTPAPTPTPAPSVPAIQARNVLFIGGSVTQGAWASPGNSYAELVGNWLKTKFDSVTVKNIAIGGTNSQFGVYRLEQDLAGFKPDIAFIEYSVNDKPNDRPFVYEHIDGLIYKLRKINPDVVIVYIATTYPAEEALRRAGTKDNRVIYAQEIVEKDGGIFVDAAFHLWHHVIGTNRNPQDFFTDTVHPNDLGHSSYYNSISEALNDRIATAKGTGTVSSFYVSQSKLDTARLVDPSAVITSTTCPTGPSSRIEFVGQSPSYYDLQYQCRAGDSFTASFSGTSIGLTSLAMVGGGKLNCTLDGVATSTVDLSDTSVRIQPQMLFDHRSNGNHTMTCETTGSVVFGDVLVSSASDITP